MRSTDRSRFGINVAGGTPGVDFEFVDDTYTRHARTGGNTLVDNLHKLVIKGSAELTLSTDGFPSATQNVTIWVNPGVQANIVLNNVNIDSPIPCHIERNRDADGKTIEPKTRLRITLAENSDNTLTATDGRQGPGIHCGEGTELVIDDHVPNVTTSGEPIKMDPEHYPGKIPAGTTFVGNDGKTYTAGTTPGGDRLSLLENATRNASKELTTGKLTVTGNSLEAAIGSVQYEDAGDMTFNGGIITTYARGAGNQYAYTASIGGGAGGSGGKMTFNGGVIETWTSYHGASIGGGGWAVCSEANAYQFADTLGNNLVQTSQGSPHTVPAASKTCAGDIYINGGVLKPHGDMHGNAIGQGCCSWNEGHEIVIAGGTVLPDTSKALSKGGNPLTECVSMGIGAQGGAVSVIGGSVRIGYVESTKSQEGFQAFINGQHSYDSAFGAWPVDTSRNDNPAVSMVAIDLMAELDKTGSSGDNPIIDWNLTVGGIDYPYGAPTQFTDGKLYLWLPEEATKKQISVKLTYADDDGNVREVLPLFREPGQAGDLLKRYLDFEIDDKDYLSSLTKYYDGTPLPAYDLASKPITTPAPDNKVLDKVTDSSGKQLIEYRYQPHDRVPGDNGENATPTGPETSSTTMPVNVGALKITLVSKQYADESSSDAEIAEFAKSYWGHRAVMWGRVMPIASQVRDLAAEWVDETDAGQKPGGNPHPSDQSLKVSAVIERAETVDGQDGSEPTKPTAAAPEGRVQLYVDGEPVGGPIELLFEDKKDEKGNVILGEDGKPAFPQNAVRAGDDGTGHYTQFFYTFKPSETDHLVPGVGAEGRHEVSLKFLPPDEEQQASGAPANFLESTDPAENPDAAPKVEVAIDPIDPNPTTKLETPDGFDPALPPPSIATNPDPEPAEPGADPDKPGDKIYKGTITLTYHGHEPGQTNPGRVELKIDTPSSGPITVETADGTILEAELVRDEDGNPVRDEDGNLTVLLDPEAVGKTELVIKQEPNGAYTGATFIYDVTVRPDATVAPAPALAKRAENLTHPGGPTQPGDRIRYTIEASNGAKGSLWTDVVVTDPLPACLELDERSVKLDNPSAGAAGKPLSKAPSVAASDVGKFSLAAPAADGRPVLTVPAGDVGGGSSATVSFECTVREGLDFSDPAAVDLANVASATGKRPSPDDPDGPDVGPVAPPDTDPATPPGPGAVVPADPKVKLSKSVENTTRPDAGVTRVGDVLRYTVELRNDGPADSCLVGAVVSDPLPAGMEPVPGSIRLAVDGGEPIAVDDAAYDRASRTVAVACGDMWGGQRAALSFDVEVTEAALGAQNANIALAHGKVPSKDPDPAPGVAGPGKPATPPSGDPDAFTPPVEPPVLVGGDPEEGDVSVGKTAENASRGDGTTHVGDTVRYEIALRNDGAGTSWMDAVIRDDVPEGLEPVSGTIRLTLPDGSEVAVDDAAYDPATRVLAVACGHLHGGQRVTLAFDALVTGAAVGADIGNVAVGLGTPPSAWDPDGAHPEPGAPFDPPGGWGAYEKSHGRVASDPAYPPGVDRLGGVIDGEADERTTIAHRLAQTGDALAAAAGTALAAALAAGALALATRRRGRAR
ncbi:DUF11 domain-containing protein [Adlercreutzia mucosicola]|uniref:DUF11 domain-containing protein n=2 Tax=Adlercreutzia mucosicola TaxID=580026 RepID=UPI0003FC3632|nr:DUF11 domain-containing protein [Adlercreutzia mucosicola]